MTDPTPSISSLDGGDLVVRARHGDGGARAMLYARHHQPVAAYLALQACADVVGRVAQVFEVAFATIAGVDGGDVAFRVHLLHHAHRAHAVVATAHGDAAWSDRSLEVALSAPLRDALGRLSAAERDVVLLRAIGGLSQVGVSNVVRQSRVAVSVVERRALMALELAYRGSRSTAVLPLHLHDAVEQHGGGDALRDLVAVAQAVPAVVPGPVLVEHFAIAGDGRRGVLRSRSAKVAAFVGAGTGKLVLGTALAAAAATGGAHVSGVITVPLLPSVESVDEPVVDLSTTTTGVGDVSTTTVEVDVNDPVIVVTTTLPAEEGAVIASPTTVEPPVDDASGDVEPGVGDDRSAHGEDNPGLGGENGNAGGNGNGVGPDGTPPGQGGENPGQGDENGNAGGNGDGVGPDGTPPGQGGENPGQGDENGNAGGNGNAGESGDAGGNGNGRNDS